VTAPACRFCGSTLPPRTLRQTIHTPADALGRARFTLEWIDPDLRDPERARSVGRRCAHRAQVFFTVPSQTRRRLAPAFGPDVVVQYERRP
jgi:hypothetical protein